MRKTCGLYRRDENTGLQALIYRRRVRRPNVKMLSTPLFLYWVCPYSLTHSSYVDFKFDDASFSENSS